MGTGLRAAALTTKDHGIDDFVAFVADLDGVAVRAPLRHEGTRIIGLAHVGADRDAVGEVECPLLAIRMRDDDGRCKGSLSCVPWQRPIMRFRSSGNEVR